MRISDWSSDVCSSDLACVRLPRHRFRRRPPRAPRRKAFQAPVQFGPTGDQPMTTDTLDKPIKSAGSFTDSVGTVDPAAAAARKHELYARITVVEGKSVQVRGDPVRSRNLTHKEASS